MGRKRKVKVVPVGQPLYRVFIDELRPPVSGFPTKKEAVLFFRNMVMPKYNYAVNPENYIEKYQPVKKVPSFQGLL